MADDAAKPKPPPAAMSDRTRMAILIAMGVAFANGAFFILSMVYYNAHTIPAPGVGELVDTAALGHAREAFALLSAIVGVATFVAEMAPREVGHALAALLGMASVAASISAFDKGLPPVMSVTLFLAGALMLALAWGSWQRSRAAWAFLIALVAVLGGVGLFGAPKIRGVLGVGLWTAMIIPAIKVVTVVALASLRREYQGPHIGSK
jgi:hypothetical protein